MNLWNLGAILFFCSTSLFAKADIQCHEIFQQAFHPPSQLQISNPHKITHILFDMDGVLVNDAEGLAHRHGITVEEFYHRRQAMKSLDPKFNYSVWLIQKYIQTTPLFETHPPMPYLEKIKQWISFWQSQGIHVSILSSVSSLTDFQDMIASQKIMWLKKNELTHILAVFARGSHDKKNFAQKDFLLIDDSPSNTTEFTQAGGQAILHTSFEDTEMALKQLQLLL